jgi:hypothetical protein
LKEPKVYVGIQNAEFYADFRGSEGIIQKNVPKR